jgi:hypothetical protein
MFQSPGTMQSMATYHQDEMLRDARHARLAREASGSSHSPIARQLVNAVIIALVILAVVAII